MTIFKQIIGRGTRIDEEHNKWFFTIMDFKKATELFRDPDFDGEPIVIFKPGDDENPVPPDPEPGEGEDEDEEGEGGDGIQKIRVSGVPAKIISERIEYIGPDGKLITESYKDFTRKQIQSEFASLDDFLTRWNSAKKKQVIIDELEEHGIVLDNLAAEIGKDYGDFDLICHIAWGQPPLTRKERANKVKKRNYFTNYGEQARAVLTALLDKYTDEGIGTLETAKILRLDPFKSMGTPVEIINTIFGGKDKFDNAIQELEQELFRQEESA
jgi:type I restriction enzyme R subunit